MNEKSQAIQFFEQHFKDYPQQLKQVLAAERERIKLENIRNQAKITPEMLVDQFGNLKPYVVH